MRNLIRENRGGKGGGDGGGGDSKAPTYVGDKALTREQGEELEKVRGLLARAAWRYGAAIADSIADPV